MPSNYNKKRDIGRILRKKAKVRKLQERDWDAMRRPEGFRDAFKLARSNVQRKAERTFFSSFGVLGRAQYQARRTDLPYQKQVFNEVIFQNVFGNFGLIGDALSSKLSQRYGLGTGGDIDPQEEFEKMRDAFEGVMQDFNSINRNFSTQRENIQKVWGEVTVVDREIKRIGRQVDDIQQELSFVREEMSTSLEQMRSELEGRREFAAYRHDEPTYGTETRGKKEEENEDDGFGAVEAAAAYGGYQAFKNTIGKHAKSGWKTLKSGAKALTIPAAAYGTYQAFQKIRSLNPSSFEDRDSYKQAIATIISQAVAEFGLIWVSAMASTFVAGALTGGIGALGGLVAGVLGGAAASAFLGNDVDFIIEEVVNYTWSQKAPDVKRQSAPKAGSVLGRPHPKTGEAPGKPPWATRQDLGTRGKRRRGRGRVGSSIPGMTVPDMTAPGMSTPPQEDTDPAKEEVGKPPWEKSSKDLDESRGLLSDLFSRISFTSSAQATETPESFSITENMFTGPAGEYGSGVGQTSGGTGGVPAGRRGRGAQSRPDPVMPMGTGRSGTGGRSSSMTRGSRGTSSSQQASRVDSSGQKRYVGSKSAVPAQGSFAATLQQGEMYKRDRMKASAYGAYNKGAGHGYAYGNENLGNMTVSEVMRRQNLPSSHPDRIFAVGAYQVIPSTLQQAVKGLNLDPNAKFDVATQDRIAAYLATEKRAAIGSYIRGESDNLSKAQEAMAMEWASMASVSKGGRSYYGGPNRAHVTLGQTKSALNDARERYAKLVEGGMDADQAMVYAMTGKSTESRDRRALQGQGDPSAPEGLVYPVTGDLAGGRTSEHGHARGRLHAGVDIYGRNKDGELVAGEDAPVYSAGNGTIVDSRRSSGYGWIVDVKDDHTGKVFRYAHIAPPYDAEGNPLKKGDKVQKGQQITHITGAGTDYHKTLMSKSIGGDHEKAIASLDKRGWGATAKPHLHFEVRDKPGQFRGQGDTDPAEIFGEPMTKKGKETLMQGGIVERDDPAEQMSPRPHDRVEESPRPHDADTGEKQASAEAESPRPHDKVKADQKEVTKASPSEPTPAEEPSPRPHDRVEESPRPHDKTPASEGKAISEKSPRPHDKEPKSVTEEKAPTPAESESKAKAEKSSEKGDGEPEEEKGSAERTEKKRQKDGGGESREARSSGDTTGGGTPNIVRPPHQPESEPEGPGHGGYGSYGRCFV